jgi:Ca2+-binding RTX toxin-like protein
MPLSLIFITPGNYTLEDNGIPGDNTSVIKDGTGTVIFTFAHPADSLAFTVSTPGVNITVNLTDSLGAANLTIGSLTDPAVTPDSIKVQSVRTTGTVTLVSNGSITEAGSDAAADIVAGQLVLSAQTGVGTGANALETQVSALEAETMSGGITLSNFGSVQIGGVSDEVDGLHVETSGNLTLTNAGTILLGDENGADTVHGGETSGSVFLTANGFDADIIATSNQDAINAAGGNITLSAGRDIGFGIIGTDFDNDVRARNNITVNAGRDFLIDGFSDLASDDFGANTGGDVTITTGRNIHVRNIAGTDGSVAAGGSNGGNVVLTTSTGGALVLDAPTSGAISSSTGNVTVNADRVLISSSSGITAGSGVVTIQSATAGRDINLGSAGDASVAVELSDAELNRIFTSNLTIGNTGSGAITVSSALGLAGLQNLQLISGTNISLESGVTVGQTLTLLAGDNVLHTAGTITAPTLAVEVDDVGDDGNVGGFGALGSLVSTTVTLSGNAEADTLKGAESVEQAVHGNGGNDIITSSGEGHYFGDGGNDTIFAGLSSGVVPEVLDGGAAVDTVDTTSFSGDYVINLATGVTNFGYESFVNFENAVTGSGADTITGTTGVNIIRTGLGNDTLNGGAGNDQLFGGGGDDLYFVDAAGDVVIEAAGEGADVVRATADYVLSDDVEELFIGGAGRDGTGNAIANVIHGGNASNVLRGLEGNDTIRGGDGRDTIIGGAGEDLIDGGTGKDTLTGGADRDVFQFRDGDFGTTRALADLITDFNHAAAEKMQLNLVDANTIAGGNQAFTWIGNGAFTGVAGQLHFAQAGGNTYVEGDTNGDGTVDFVIALTGTINLVAGDFVL